MTSKAKIDFSLLFSCLLSNVLFSNGWIADDDGKVFIYYASSDTRLHVATSTIDRLIDYAMWMKI
jgi:predicted GH43/DUF377 family glycosyl hydrolase